MILLSNVTNEKAVNLMCEITSPMINILGDEKITEALQHEVKDCTVAEIRKIGMERIVKLANIIMKDHADDFFSIFAPFFEKSVDEFKQDNFLQSIKGIMQIVKDEDFLIFLEQLGFAKTPLR